MKSKADTIEKEKLIELVKESNSFNDLTVKVGYSSASSGSVQRVRNRVKQENICTKHFSIRNGRTPLADIKKEKFIEVVNNSLNIKDILEYFNFSPNSGSMAQLVRKRINNLNLDISHFGKKPNRYKYTLEELLIDNSSYSTYKLKKRLIKEGILEYRCTECRITNKYNKKTIELQLDHINGKAKDHRIENLRILCPNCHSQTDTFGGKNTKK